MIASDLTTLTDAELDRAIGAAVLDKADTRPLEQERDRRRRAVEHAALGDAERARRTQADAETEHTALVMKLLAQRDEYRAAFVARVNELSVTPPADAGPVIEGAYTLGRQAYAISHDLADETGDRRLALRYDVTDQIALHGGAAGEAFVASLRGHAPPVPTPFRDDVNRLRALSPRQSLIGNGG